jgi:hypothetical protein
VLDSCSDFWSEIRKARVLMIDRRVQMVYLTAMLSSADKAEFLDIIKVQISNDYKF